MSLCIVHIPGVNLLSVVSTNTDCVGSAGFAVHNWPFDVCAVPLVVVNGLQRRRFVGRWFSDSQSKLRFNVAHAIFVWNTSTTITKLYSQNHNWQCKIVFVSFFSLFFNPKYILSWSNQNQNFLFRYWLVCFENCSTVKLFNYSVNCFIFTVLCFTILY